MTAPKGVRVTVERGRAIRDWARVNGAWLCWRDLRKAGVPALRPGKSVTGRMVFVPDKKKGAK